jgi:hypothetical protein
MKHFFKNLSCTSLILFTIGGFAQPNERTNIILIVADDLGYADISYNDRIGSVTPQLNLLAREGLRFTDFHANAPVCSPTRTALLTGRYQQRSGIESALRPGAIGLLRSEIPIDSKGVLPDGTPINDITDFKAWLVDNSDLFSQCLSEKLMIYATGRVPNYAERHEIAQLVRQNYQNGNGFQDLFLALVTSETFRTK